MLPLLHLQDGDLIPTGNPDEYIITCPDCGRNKCYANPRKGFAYCQRCGKGYRLRTGSTTHHRSDRVQINPNIRYDSLAAHEMAVRYLVRRGYQQNFAERIGVRARLVGRETAIGFPSDHHHAYERRVTSAEERGTDWLTPGHKLVWIAADNPQHEGIVLVEGVFDAMRVALAGFTAAACHGKSVPWERIPWSSIPGSDRVLVLFDSDAVSEAKIAVVRGASLGKKALQLSGDLPAKDPDLCPVERLKELLTSGLRILSTP